MGQVYLLRSTMPFRYIWVSDAAREAATLVFYILTGLYFRPHAQNPYFAVSRACGMSDMLCLLHWCWSHQAAAPEQLCTLGWMDRQCCSLRLYAAVPNFVICGIAGKCR